MYNVHWVKTTRDHDALGEVDPPTRRIVQLKVATRATAMLAI